MQIIKSIEEISALEDNKIIGADGLILDNVTIKFKGKNNILFCDGAVHIIDSVIEFNGSNSVVYLSSNRFEYRLRMLINNNSVFYSGKDNYYNGGINATLSEQKHIFIGDDGLLSFGGWIRTSDIHLVYSTETKKRLNPSKSVYIGDRVWLGQNVIVLKGSRIHSGSIIGAGAVLAGKRVPSNVSFAGNPARQIATGVFWDNPSVHTWTNRQTAEHRECSEDKGIYENSSDYIPFDEIEKRLDSAKAAEEKLEYLKELSLNKSKNRFAYVPVPKPEPTTFRHKVRMKLKRLIERILK